MFICFPLLFLLSTSPPFSIPLSRKCTLPENPLLVPQSGRAAAIQDSLTQSSSLHLSGQTWAAAVSVPEPRCKGYSTTGCLSEEPSGPANAWDPLWAHPPPLLPVCEGLPIPWEARRPIQDDSFSIGSKQQELFKTSLKLFRVTIYLWRPSPPFLLNVSELQAKEKWLRRKRQIPNTWKIRKGSW